METDGRTRQTGWNKWNPSHASLNHSNWCCRISEVHHEQHAMWLNHDSWDRLFPRITAQISNIDTKNCHIFKGSYLFQTIILGIHVSFRGCKALLRDDLTTICASRSVHIRIYLRWPLPELTFVKGSSVWINGEESLHGPENCSRCNFGNNGKLPDTAGYYRRNGVGGFKHVTCSISRTLTASSWGSHHHPIVPPKDADTNYSTEFAL